MSVRHVLVFMLALAISACASRSATAPANPKDEQALLGGSRLVSVESTADFDQTVSQLQNAITKRGFKTFVIIDHAKGAASIGEELRPTTLFIFGNPNGGTPLIQANQLMGLALPLKLLVVENADGDVSIHYQDMAYIFLEYGIAEMSAPLEKISGALGGIASEAAKGGD